jgi:hypothetical protein
MALPPAPSGQLQPPLANVPFTKQDERFKGQSFLTVPALNFLQALWAGIQGGGGVIDKIAILFGMHGDVEITDDGVTTIQPGVVSTGKIADAAVTTAKIADAAVTTAKVADGNITTAKLAAGAVTTAKITDKNVTYAKIQDVTDARILGRSAGSAGPTQEITVATGLSLSGGILSAYIFTGVVGSLPAAGASGAGARAFVTDALGPAFATAVVGGGAVKCPVYSDGAAWLAG